MATPPDFTAGSILTAAQMNQVGLWLIKTQTVGTAVTTVTVNDAFSADFVNYKIIYTDGVASADTNIGLRLGAKTTNYRSGLIYNAWNNTTASIGTTTGGSMVFAGNATTAGNFMSVEVFSPFLSTRNTFCSGQWSSPTEGGVSQMNTGDTVSYTSFTFILGGGNITGGTIRVYGYRN